MKEPHPGIVQGALISDCRMHFLGAEFIMMGMLDREGSPWACQEGRLHLVGAHPPKLCPGTLKKHSIRRGHCHLLPQPAGDGLCSSAQVPTREHCITPPIFCLASLSSLLSVFLSPDVPRFHQISEGRSMHSAASAPVLCGLNCESLLERCWLGLALVLPHFAAVNTWSCWLGTSAEGRRAWQAEVLSELPTWAMAESPSQPPALSAAPGVKQWDTVNC